MEKKIIIHLDKPNTLSQHLTNCEIYNISILKITGVIGRKDLEDVLDDMCTAWGTYDDDDNFIPDLEETPALRHLDLGDSEYVDGTCMPPFGYKSQLESFILPKGLESFGGPDNGICGTDTLRHIVFQNGIKIIGNILSCPNLANIAFPDSLEEICPFTFTGCSSITSVRLPSRLKSFDGTSFAGCNIKAFEIDENNPYFSVIDGVVYNKDLTVLVAFPSAFPNKHFDIPKSTITIGHGAFMDSKLETISIPDGVKNIDEDAFEGSSLKRIEMPDSVINVGRMAFRSCFELERVRLSNSLSVLPAQLFGSCPRLKELDVPSSVKQIYYSTIAWSGGLERLHLHDGLEEIVDEGPMLGTYGELYEVNLPKTLKKIQGGLFNYSEILNDYNLDSDSPYFKVIDSALCSYDGKEIFAVPGFCRTEYVIPEGIEVIGIRAFAFLPNIKFIKLPQTIKEIKSRAFQGCSSLLGLVIPSSIERVDIDALWADNLKYISIDKPTPPKMTGHVSKEKDWRYKDVELYVPKDSVEEYKKAPGWNSFNVKPL